MGQNQNNVDADPEAVKDSKKLWAGFTIATKYSIIGIVIILALMALFLL